MPSLTCEHKGAKLSNKLGDDVPVLQLLVQKLGREQLRSTPEAQHVPDHARYVTNKTDETTQAYPTDAAEKKRNAKRAAKEAGIEWEVGARVQDMCSGDRKRSL